MQQNFFRFDNQIIGWCQRLAVPLARVSLFIVYFWFGFLKILAASPASPLVMQLQQKTLPFLSFSQFIVLFGLFEMLIGFVFLFPRLIRLAAGLFAFHIITTFLPLIFLPTVTWQGFLTPTLEGQYIIKNVVLVALVVVLIANLNPMKNMSPVRNDGGIGESSPV